MAVVLTLVQTKQIRIYINEIVQKTSTKHSKHKYTFYQHTHTLQTKYKQPQHKIHTQMK